MTKDADGKTALTIAEEKLRSLPGSYLHDDYLDSYQLLAEAERRARTAKRLDEMLPQVGSFAIKSNDDWHPGMAAPALAAPQSNDAGKQQIQTRSRSQGLRF